MGLRGTFSANMHGLDSTRGGLLLHHRSSHVGDDDGQWTSLNLDQPIPLHLTPPPAPHLPRPHCPTPTATQAAAVLLLRLLSWKRIGNVMASGEALRYVFILGAPGAGKAHLFAQLASLPSSYKVRGARLGAACTTASTRVLVDGCPAVLPRAMHQFHPVVHSAHRVSRGRPSLRRPRL